MMLLFRACRSIQHDIFDPIRKTFAGPPATDDLWPALYKEYQRWLDDDISSLAHSFHSRNCDTMAQDPPQFNTKVWWACMVYTRIRNLELVLRSHRDIVDRAPENIMILPKFEEGAQQHEDTCMNDDDTHSRIGSEHGSEHEYGHGEKDPCESGHDKKKVTPENTSHP